MSCQVFYYRQNVCVLLKFICWSPSPTVAIFGNGYSKQVLRLNKVIRVGPWPDRISVHRKTRQRSGLLSMHTHRGGLVSTQLQEPSASPEEGRELLPSAEPAGPLIWDFSPPVLWESAFLLAKTPNLWHFV